VLLAEGRGRKHPLAALLQIIVDVSAATIAAECLSSTLFCGRSSEADVDTFERGHGARISADPTGGAAFFCFSRRRRRRRRRR